MSKKRIYEFAKEIDQSNKAIVDKAQSLGMDIKNHMGSISSEQEKQLKAAFKGGAKPAPKGNAKQAAKPAEKPASQRPNAARPNFDTSERPASQRPNAARPNFSADERKVAPKPAQQKPAASKPVAKPAEKPVQQKPAAPKPAAKSTERPAQQKPAASKPVAKPAEKPAQQKPAASKLASKPAERPAQQKPAASKPAQQQNRPAQNQNNRPAQGQNQNACGGQQGGQNNRGGQGGYQGRSNNNYRPGGQGGYQGRNNNRFNKKGRKKQYPASNKPAVPARKFKELPEVLVYTEGMNVAEISKKIFRDPAEIIKKLFMMGVMVNQNQALDNDTIELLAVEYGIEAEEKVAVDVADIDKFFEPEAIEEGNLQERPPVVTIMGHVDHGKTTLLDTLRNTKVTDGEAGGITQHIGAYQIDVDGKTITFLDTPGHAAFTSMRARGASITDITILVVAADDGVMPQTIEAINHAKAADVPIIVAVNKIDKPGANPENVIGQLSEHGLIPEAWGGDTMFVNISAKNNENIDELLENIVLISEVQELKADPTQRAIGSVIEARLDKGKGTVATLLVQQGTLRIGDPIVVGNTFGRVRTMTNDMGRRDKEAGPATPVEITGLNDVPQAGDRFVVFEDEKTARAAGEERAARALSAQRNTNTVVTLDNLFDSLKDGEIKDVNVIIKADVQGTAEALSASLQKIEVEGVRVKIVHSAVGAITESDITLASASGAIVVGFNVRPTLQARQQAEQDEVDIRLHSIIYNVIDEIETAMNGLLEPEYEEVITGQMLIRETYTVSKVGTIGGCYVTDGSIKRDGGIRLIRDNIVIHEGKLASLKRFKDDAKEVKMGFECGAMIEDYNDIKVDDVIEGFEMVEIKRK